MIEEQTRQVASISINEVILAQLRDLKEGQRDLNRRMDRIETRMDNLETKIEDTRKELNAKLEDTRKELNDKIEGTRKELNERIDKLANKMDSSTHQGQIATISTIGIGVAAVSSTVAMLYSLFSK
ncbi:MAG: hypothetical protein IKD73_00715 [Selenomonadaceae bacterium]|nr:hypothetical protein [Selenomonadaceae bacterium]